MRLQGSRSSEKARQFLYGTLRAADTSMARKIKLVVERVADKVSFDYVTRFCCPTHVCHENLLANVTRYCHTSHEILLSYCFEHGGIETLPF